MIWELRNDLIGQVAVLVETDMQTLASPFLTDGNEKNWKQKPMVMPFVEKRKNQQKPRADISHLCPGAIVLNQIAYEKLFSLLAPFGQLLAIDCEGATEYFYNVTKIVSGIDIPHSEFDDGLLKKERFPVDFLNDDIPVIFKDPLTIRTRIYANDAAKRKLENIIQQEKITGLKFSEPGSKPY